MAGLGGRDSLLARHGPADDPVLRPIAPRHRIREEHAPRSLYFLPIAPNLAADETYMPEEFKLAGVLAGMPEPPCLVVIDTLNRSLPSPARLAGSCARK